jgi:lipoprotein-releasing system permease protein
LKGVDANYSKVNAESKLYNGQWLQPNTYQVVVGYGIAQKFSLGLLDFNRQLEVLAPKPGKGAIENPEEAFNKTDLIPLFMLLVKT